MKKKKLSALIAFTLLVSSVNPVYSDVYSSLPQSTAPLASSVIIKNNYIGTSDTLTINKLLPGDFVSVYSSIPTTTTTPLATALVPSDKTNVDITIAQLGQVTGSVYVTVVNDGSVNGSTKTNVSSLSKLDYATEVTPSLSIENITTINNTGYPKLNNPDLVTVEGLHKGDILSVYSDQKKDLLLGTINITSTTGIIKVPQLGEAGGTIYVAVKTGLADESVPIKIQVAAEIKTPSTIEENVTVTNNIGMDDTIVVKGLNSQILAGEKGIVNVYLDSAEKILLATQNIGVGVLITTPISVTQLGKLSGSLYVTVTTESKLESLPTKIDYKSELQTPAPDNIKVTNNTTGVSDTILVSGLNGPDADTPGDKVNVYSDAAGKILIGTATVADSFGTATISVPQLGVKASNIYVTVTQPGKNESVITKVVVEAEQVTSSPSPLDIIVTNNIASTDNVTFKNLLFGDIVNVYSDSAGKVLIGTTRVLVTGGTTSIDIAQLGQISGNIYITVKNINKLESIPIKVAFLEETKSEPIDSSNVSVTNNTSTRNDNIGFYGLTSGDKVSVYADAAGKILIGTIIISGTSGSIQVPQLGQLEGSIYVTLTSNGKLESLFTKITYSAEPITDQLSIANVTVANNIGIPDVITAKNINLGDTVNVYSDAAGKILIGTSKAAGSPVRAYVSVKQLGVTSGFVYVSVITTNKLESVPTKVAYVAEERTDSPAIFNMEVTNNIGFSNDFMIMDNLLVGDIVNIYSDAAGKNIIGTKKSVGSMVIVNGLELGETAGNVYASVTTLGKLESVTTKVAYIGEPKSTAPEIGNIRTTNNIEGTLDKVTVNVLATSDEVKVYADLAGKILLGKGTNTSGTVVINITQLGQVAGSVYVTATTTGMLESVPTKVAYSGETLTVAPISTTITVTNNLDNIDTVLLSGIVSTDIINVYADSTTRVLLGTNSYYSNKLSPILINQLGQNSGSLYVTKISLGKLESLPTKVDYLGETKTKTPLLENIKVTNNIDSYDNVIVSNLTSGDVVNIYADATKKILLSTSNAINGVTSVSLLQLGKVAGNIYVTVKNSDKLESLPTTVTYAAEAVTPILDAKNIIITNNIGSSDIITVNNLNTGDIVNVFSDVSEKTLIGKGTEVNGTTSINVPQLGQPVGFIYLTVKNSDKLESLPSKISYAAEAKTSALVIKKIIVTGNTTVSNYETINNTVTVIGSVTIVNNNIGSIDSILVDKLTSGARINVYSDVLEKNLLGTVTAGLAGTASVSVAEIGQVAGSIYVTVTNPGELESSPTKVTYSSELMLTPTDVGSITVVSTNNIAVADQLVVKGLNTIYTNRVNVYSDASKKILIKTVDVALGISTTSISVTQLGQEAGYAYVTVTTTGMVESSIIKVPFIAEPKAVLLNTDNIKVTNNTRKDDTIVVSNLTVGDKVKVYSDAAEKVLLGTTTVITGGTSALISVVQLGQAAGTLYVTQTKTGVNESLPLKVAYKAEEKTASLAIQNITLSNNNASMDDIEVAFTSLQPGDIVNIYADTASKILMGTKTVKGGTSVGNISSGTDANEAFKLSLGQAAGNIYITVTSLGKLESTQTKVDYLNELKTTALANANLQITNNIGQSDEIQVNGLSVGDIVNVYSDAAGKTLLGSVTSNGAKAMIKLSLGQVAGSVYVSVITTGRFESSPIKVAYSSEARTTSPVSGNITVINNIGGADTIAVNNLASKDVVNVYADAAEKILLGTANETGGRAFLSLTQLGAIPGSLYVTVKNQGLTESLPTKIAYAGEIKTAGPDLKNIKITNVVGAADTIEVAGLIAGDNVKVFSDAGGKTLLGIAIVEKGKTQVSINIAQLGKAGGKVYITVTTLGKNESLPTTVTVIGEPITTSPATANIKVTNNNTGNDTVYVANLISGDIVSVYADAAKKILLVRGTTTTLSISQLGKAAGSIYVTITSNGKLESATTKIDFTKEQQLP